MKVIRVLFAGFLLFFSALFAQDLQFYREDLDFEIRANHFHVDGFYYFRNQSPQKITRTLFYPFPQDSLYGIVDSVFAVDCQPDSLDVLLSRKEHGALFKIEIEPDSSAVYRIGYRQELFSCQAEYILTTTQNWKRPFELVNYSLILPKNLQLDSLSYSPDSLEENNRNYIFFWHKENFMPDRNFIIQFHAKEEK